MKRILNFVVMAVMAQFMLLHLAAILSQGFTWTRVIWIHVYLIGITIAIIWERQGRRAGLEREAAEAMEMGGAATMSVPNVPSVPVSEPKIATPPAPAVPAPLVSMVLLLEKPITEMNESDLASRLSLALGTTFSTQTVDRDHLVKIDRENFDFTLDGQRYGLTFAAKPYVKDRETEAKAVRGPNLARAIRTHEAWCAVDAIGTVTDKDAAYRVIGKAITELANGATPMAMFCPEDGRMTTWDAAMPQSLRSEHPRAVFGE